MSFLYSLKCASCGDELLPKNFSIKYDGDLYVEVDACEKCLEEAYQEGKNE